MHSTVVLRGDQESLDYDGSLDIEATADERGPCRSYARKLPVTIAISKVEGNQPSEDHSSEPGDPVPSPRRKRADEESHSSRAREQPPARTAYLANCTAYIASCGLRLNVSHHSRD